MAEKTLTIRITDDGTISVVNKRLKGLNKTTMRTAATSGVLNRNMKGTAQATSNLTKSFAKQSQGMGGLVAAYATVAANIFAVTAAFGALKRASALAIQREAMVQYAASTGIAIKSVVRDLQLATDGVLTFKDAASGATLALSAGLSSTVITKLGKSAANIAKLLGRDVTESFNRLIRGVVKGEPELLDELGIFIRLDKVYAAYGKTVKKTAKELTEFEKLQARQLAVTKQAADKFDRLGDAIRGNPYEQLAAQFEKFSNVILEGVSGKLLGIIDMLSRSPIALYGGFAILASTILKRIVPGIASMATGLKEATIQGLRLSKLRFGQLQSLKGLKAGGARGAFASATRHLTDQLATVNPTLRTNIKAALLSAAKDEKFSTTLGTKVYTSLHRAGTRALKNLETPEKKIGKGSMYFGMNKAQIEAIMVQLRGYKTVIVSAGKVTKEATGGMVVSFKIFATTAKLAFAQASLSASRMTKRMLRVQDTFQSTWITIGYGFKYLFAQVKRAEVGMYGFGKSVMAIRLGATLAANALKLLSSAFMSLMMGIGTLIMVFTILKDVVNWLIKITGGITKAGEVYKEAIEGVTSANEEMTKALRIHQIALEDDSALRSSIQQLTYISNAYNSATGTIVGLAAAAQRLQKEKGWADEFFSVNIGKDVDNLKTTLELLIETGRASEKLIKIHSDLDKGLVKSLGGFVTYAKDAANEIKALAVLSAEVKAANDDIISQIKAFTQARTARLEKGFKSPYDREISAIKTLEKGLLTISKTGIISDEAIQAMHDLHGIGGIEFSKEQMVAIRGMSAQATAIREAGEAGAKAITESFTSGIKTVAKAATDAMDEAISGMQAVDKESKSDEEPGWVSSLGSLVMKMVSTPSTWAVTSAASRPFEKEEQKMIKRKLYQMTLLEIGSERERLTRQLNNIGAVKRAQLLAIIDQVTAFKKELENIKTDFLVRKIATTTATALGVAVRSINIGQAISQVMEVLKDKATIEGSHLARAKRAELAQLEIQLKLADLANKKKLEELQLQDTSLSALEKHTISTELNTKYADEHLSIMATAISGLDKLPPVLQEQLKAAYALTLAYRKQKKAIEAAKSAEKTLEIKVDTAGRALAADKQLASAISAQLTLALKDMGPNGGSGARGIEAALRLNTMLVAQQKALTKEYKAGLALQYSVFNSMKNSEEQAILLTKIVAEGVEYTNELLELENKREEVQRKYMEVIGRTDPFSNWDATLTGIYRQLEQHGKELRRQQGNIFANIAKAITSATDDFVDKFLNSIEEGKLSWRNTIILAGEAVRESIKGYLTDYIKQGMHSLVSEGFRLMLGGASAGDVSSAGANWAALQSGNLFGKGGEGSITASNQVTKSNQQEAVHRNIIEQAWTLSEQRGQDMLSHLKTIADNTAQGAGPSGIRTVPKETLAPVSEIGTFDALASFHAFDDTLKTVGDKGVDATDKASDLNVAGLFDIFGMNQQMYILNKLEFAWKQAKAARDLLGKIFGFAHGGIVHQPTNAIIGEGRNSEAVVPLPDNRSIPVKIEGGVTGAAPSINLTQNFDFTNADSKTVEQFKKEAARIKKETIQATFALMDRGGSYAKRAGRRR